MSRPGNPYDNAKAESFMKTLKTEEVNGKAYNNIDEARRQIGEFIETVYNESASIRRSAINRRPSSKPNCGRSRQCQTRNAVTELAVSRQGVQSKLASPFPSVRPILSGFAHWSTTGTPRRRMSGAPGLCC